MVGTLLQHEVVNGHDPICDMSLPTVRRYLQHKVTNAWDQRSL